MEYWLSVACDLIVEAVKKIISGDETWIYVYYPQTNRNHYNRNPIPLCINIESMPSSQYNQNQNNANCHSQLKDC
jgi:hypothetical protein